jgi:hypothetical protein
MYSATYSPVVAVLGTVQEADCGQLFGSLLLASISPVCALGLGVVRVAPEIVLPIPLQPGTQAIWRAPAPLLYQPSL